MPLLTSTVAVSRRQLSAHPVRSAAGTAGIGLALMLMLLLDALWTGVRAQTTVFEDRLQAQLVVVSPGTDALFADPSTLPRAALARVAAVPGVDWVAPLRATYAILDVHGSRAAVALVGAQPGAPGNPWRLRSGRAARTNDEIVLDTTFADRHGLDLGDRLPVLGQQLRVVGISGDSAMFMTPLVFVTERAAATLLRSPATTGVVLVGTRQADEVATALRQAGITVRTPAQLHESALRLATRIFGAPLRLMVAVAFVAGTLLVALVAHTQVTEQRRDLAVLSALGAHPSRLARLTLTQTALLTAVGAVLSVGLLLVAQVVIGVWRPQFPVVLTVGTAMRTAAAAAAMAVLAAALPARRVARLDPASAFRSAS